MRPRALCIDFDKTLVKGHFHSFFSKAKTKKNSMQNGVQVRQKNGFFKNIFTGESISQNKGASEQEIQGLLSNDKFGPKNPNHMADTIRLAIDGGHAVAITSFTLYPEVILPTLRFIGLEERYIEKIAIIGGFPSHGEADNSPDGKEQHISAALAEFRSQGMRLDRSDVMLVDDSKHNIDVANTLSKTNVLVPVIPNPDPTYFQDINAFIQKPAFEVASQLNALSNAQIKKFRDKDGTYMKFANDQEYQEGRTLLKNIFGEDAFRIAKHSNTIEINDRQIIALLKSHQGESNKIKSLKTELQKWNMYDYLGSLNIRQKYEEVRRSESTPIRLLKEGKALTFGFKVKSRDKQILNLEKKISSIRNDDLLTNKEQAEKLYRVMLELSSDIKKENNFLPSSLNKIAKEIEKELLLKYPDLKEQAGIKPRLK